MLDFIHVEDQFWVPDTSHLVLDVCLSTPCLLDFYLTAACLCGLSASFWSQVFTLRGRLVVDLQVAGCWVVGVRDLGALFAMGCLRMLMFGPLTHRTWSWTSASPLPASWTSTSRLPASVDSLLPFGRRSSHCVGGWS